MGPEAHYDARPGIATAPTNYPDRVVRDGVTVKLAPAAAPRAIPNIPKSLPGQTFSQRQWR